MGDRGNIYVITEKNWDPPSPRLDEQGRTMGVLFYTHWRGSDIQTVVKEALEKQWRWDDPPYLARIIFDTLTARDHGSETGYGIAVRPPDNSHPIIVVDPCTSGGRIWLASEDDFYLPFDGPTATFEEFLALPEYASLR